MFATRELLKASGEGSIANKTFVIQVPLLNSAGPCCEHKHVTSRMHCIATCPTCAFRSSGSGV